MTGHYNVLVIAVVLLASYLTSFILSRLGRIKPRTHRAVWNVLLLLTAAATGLMGLVMALRRDIGFELNLPFSIGFWHVEAGVALTLIAIFHIGWHLGYFRSLLRGQDRPGPDPETEHSRGR